ncbi:MAG: hypothetical protein ACOCUW_02975 [Gemmatimonadota bacterium]
MNPKTIVRSGVLALMVLAPAAVSAQAGDRGMLGIGYAANAPSVVVGATVWGIVPGLRGWGLYVDGKMDPDDPSSDPYFMAALTPSDIATQYPDDEEVTQEDRWQSFNAAVTRVLTDELIVYAGGGYSHRTTYRQYLDPDRNRGQFGLYWVEDPVTSGGEVNLLAGALLRISSRIRLQFGGETAPRGFTVGASLTLGG